MMISIKGTFQNGVAQSIEPAPGRDGQTVIITFLEEAIASSTSEDPSGWDQLMQVIEHNTMDMGERGWTQMSAD